MILFTLFNYNIIPTFEANHMQTQMCYRSASNNISNFLSEDCDEGHDLLNQPTRNKIISIYNISSSIFGICHTYIKISFIVFYYKYIYMLQQYYIYFIYIYIYLFIHNRIKQLINLVRLLINVSHHIPFLIIFIFLLKELEFYKTLRQNVFFF